MAACGDTIIFFSVTLGTVASEPACGGGNQHFNLRDQQGLVLLVTINSNTRIVAANGQTAQCSDIVPQAPVQVRGHRGTMTITAQTVQLL